MENICRKVEDSHENYGLMKKREEKQKCHVRKYNTKINMTIKSLLKPSTQPKDRTKACAKEVHPQV
jgi:hypothetical protein